MGPSFDAYLKHIREAAGTDASACGVVSLNGSRRAALSCAGAALEEGRPFWVVFQVMGIDSQIFEGLAVDAHGRVQQLTWDSDITGGYEIVARRQIWDKPCLRPQVVQGTGSGPIECQEEHGAEQSAKPDARAGELAR